MAESSERAMSPDEAAYIAAARAKGFVLYEGVLTPHRIGADELERGGLVIVPVGE